MYFFGKYTGGRLAAIAGLLLGAACAAAPINQLPEVEQAIASAIEAKAEQYASELLRRAIADVDEAQRIGGAPAQELLQRARLEAEVAAALARERALAEQLQAAREQRDAAKSAAAAAKKAADTAKEELTLPVIGPFTDQPERP